MSNHVEVHVNVKNRKEAVRVIKGALEKRVAAFGQILGPSGIWSIQNGRAKEYSGLLVILQSTQESLKGLTDQIRADHSADVPDIVAVPIVGGLAEHLGQITGETAGRRPDGLDR